MNLVILHGVKSLRSVATLRLTMFTKFNNLTWSESSGPYMAPEQGLSETASRKIVQEQETTRNTFNIKVNLLQTLGNLASIVYSKWEIEIVSSVTVLSSI
uniref:Uncharacterized protein n=1 Tax=Photinus pyralis TaxID=7054 RepID=A0A1Y1KJG6_PHOPY